MANSTYMLSYDIGIGSLLMGFMQESIGLTTGFALTAVAYVVGGMVYIAYSDGYFEYGCKPEAGGFEITISSRRFLFKK